MSHQATSVATFACRKCINALASIKKMQYLSICEARPTLPRHAVSKGNLLRPPTHRMTSLSHLCVAFNYQARQTHYFGCNANIILKAIFIQWASHMDKVCLFVQVTEEFCLIKPIKLLMSIGKTWVQQTKKSNTLIDYDRAWFRWHLVGLGNKLPSHCSQSRIIHELYLCETDRTERLWP